MGFIGLKCQYIFNVTKRIFVKPAITIGYEAVSLDDKSKTYYTHSSHYHKHYVSTVAEDFFTVMPALDFKYVFKKGGGIVLSAKYQLFPFLGKNYFSSPQSNEGFMFSIGWEWQLKKLKPKYKHKYDYFHRNDYHDHNHNYWLHHIQHIH